VKTSACVRGIKNARVVNRTNFSSLKMSPKSENEEDSPLAVVNPEPESEDSHSKRT
jgi:hypothetical protein